MCAKLSLGLAVVLFGAGCNNGKSQEKAEAPGPTPVPAEVNIPDPVVEPTPPPQVLTKAARGGRYVLMDARDGTGAVVSLSVAGKEVHFSAESLADTPTLRTAKIMAAFGEIEQEVFLCELPKTAKSGAEIVVGADGAAHVICTKGPEDELPGFMEGKRLQWNDDRSQLLESGSWAGEGVVDVDSLELDEGEDYPAE